MNIKHHIFKIGDYLTNIGEKYNINFFIYNPITWARFFFSSRRSGLIFANILKETYPEIITVCDVGAGSGGYLLRLQQANYKTCGVEYSALGRFLALLQGVKIHHFDCSDYKELPKLGKFDLAYSIEVGEHIPAELASNFVKYITSLSDFIIFSAALPGQGGQGHINEQTQEYWRKLFLIEGYEYQPNQTINLSAKLREKKFRGWLPKNIQVFKSQNHKKS